MTRACFRIETDAVIAGDYNGDGRVDGGDYDVWIDAYGSDSASLADGDGVVDARDYAIWRDNLGATAQSYISPAQQAAVAPEPASAILCLFAATPVAHDARYREC